MLLTALRSWRRKSVLRQWLILLLPFVGRMRHVGVITGAIITTIKTVMLWVAANHSHFSPCALGG
ncbi:hypothetical protein KCP75_20075 [Salmonella enterica subsp. enterica]|nr:hypothetical protein KCP75_20075 [Salmonella enterica subsp. enterica]